MAYLPPPCSLGVPTEIPPPVPPALRLEERKKLLSSNTYLLCALSKRMLSNVIRMKSVREIIASQINRYRNMMQYEPTNYLQESTSQVTHTAASVERDRGCEPRPVEAPRIVYRDALEDKLIGLI